MEMEMLNERLPRLNLPDRLDDPEEVLRVLRRLGLGPASAPSAEARLAAGQSLLSTFAQRITEAQVSAALSKFEVASSDRIAIKLALVRHRLLAA
jgi:hypothetical protein